jgi:hypothetical protein
MIINGWWENLISDTESGLSHANGLLKGEIAETSDVKSRKIFSSHLESFKVHFLPVWTLVSNRNLAGSFKFPENSWFDRHVNDCFQLLDEGHSPSSRSLGFSLLGTLLSIGTQEENELKKEKKWMLHFNFLDYASEKKGREAYFLL